MRPATQSTVEQERVIDEARRVLEADRRIAACWLEGSFASGTADAWSDVDTHVAVRDEDFDGFLAERLETLNRIRTVLAYGENPLPWGAHLVYTTMSGPVRFDLYIERLGNLERTARPGAVQILFEREPVGPRFQSSGDLDAQIRAWLAGLVRSLFFGAMWPVRLWGRQEWGSLLMNSLVITYQFLVPAMLAQDDPPNYYRPFYHNEHRLTPTRLRQIDELLDETLAAFQGIGSGKMDLHRVARLCERQLTLIFRELRAACATYGVPYPEAAEQEMRRYYHRELGININL